MSQMNVQDRFADYAARVAHSVTADELGFLFYQNDIGGYYRAIAEGASASSWAAVPTTAACGFIPVSIADLHEADATILAAFADGASSTPGYTIDNSEAFGIRWNNHANPDPVGTTIPLPKDIDTNVAMTMYVAAAKSGATEADAVTWLVEAFFVYDGVLADSDADAGGTSSAMTGTATAKTVQVETLTLAAANLPDLAGNAGGVLSFTIQPTDGTLGTDDVTIHGIWFEYTKLPTWG